MTEWQAVLTMGSVILYACEEEFRMPHLIAAVLSIAVFL